MPKFLPSIVQAVARAALIVAAFVIVPGVVHAQDIKGPIAVQFKAMTLPAVSEKGYLGRTSLTPYMLVTDAEALQRVCARLPRLLDVIQVAFDESPVKLGDRVNDLAARQKVLATKIEASLGTGVFEGFYLVQGSRRSAEGTEALQVDGGNRDCQPIKYFPWKREVPTAVRDTMAKIAETVEPPLEAPADVSSEASAAMPAPAATQQPTPSLNETLQPYDNDPLPSPEEIARTMVRKFPPEPPKPEQPPWVMFALVIMGMGGAMLVIGSYIGYQVAKIRRERRRKDRRKKKKDRRLGQERRLRNDGPPTDDERRESAERRAGKDRRKRDRRDTSDRRDEPPENEPPEEDPPGKSSGSSEP
tara:strand:- start:30513 stop:31592 length:1080 start_codon:yes stop_codon:yes gene_type:complete